MAIVTYNCTGCKPIDRSIIDVYIQLMDTEAVTSANEASRVTEEEARVSAETARETAFTNDHNRAGTDHSTYVSDHNRASADHDTFVVDHANAVADRNGYNADHETAVSDHGKAVTDHANYGVDHVNAANDHTRAASDHTRATNDHTASVSATERANAAADAAEHAAMQVGKYYGFYAESSQLPSGLTDPGYALVGETSPFDVWNFDGTSWSDSGTKMDSIPIVNDLTTGGTSSALSAEMGKTLNNTKQANLVSGTNIKTVNGESLLGSGNIVAGDPNAVKYTEQTLTDAQKTQARTNIGAGTYTKAGTGIPKTDLESGAQQSLNLADTAIQARPMGEVDPTITPATYATKEELDELDLKVDELEEELHEINPHITGRMGIGDTNDDITTSTLPEYTDQYGIATIVFNTPGYLWVCLENDSFRVTSGGIEIPMNYVKDSNGLHCFVSAEMINAGTLQFKVESIHPIKSDTERLTITARSYIITYGDALPDFGYTANGVVEGTPGITCEAVQGSDAGTYAIHIARGTVTDDNAIYVDGVLTIAKAELTVTADNKFVELNGTMPTFTMQYSGFVLGEDTSDLDVVPTCTTDAEDTATAGAYTITPSGGVSDNYSFVYVPGILRVGFTTLLSWTAAELFAGKSVGGYIDVSTNKKKTSTNYWGIVINVDGLQGKTVKFTKNDNYNFFRFAFMKSCGAWTNNGTVSFSDATGYSAQVESNADTLSAEIPADTKYIYVYTTYNQNTNTAPDIEITGTAETSKTTLLAASLFTANKTIGPNGTVYTGNDAKTVFCTIDPLRVETYSFLHDVAVTLANMPAAYDLMAFAIAQYTASNMFIRRVGYKDIPDSVELDPAADYFHIMMFGSLNGTQVNISSVPIGDNDIQLTVIDN